MQFTQAATIKKLLSLASTELRSKQQSALSERGFAVKKEYMYVSSTAYIYVFVSNIHTYINMFIFPFVYL